MMRALCMQDRSLQPARELTHPDAIERKYTAQAGQGAQSLPAADSEAPTEVPSANHQ